MVLVMAPTTTPTPRGTVFRVARQAAGVSVRSVAVAADVSHATVSRWERGEREVAAETYERLTQALADLMQRGAA